MPTLAPDVVKLQWPHGYRHRESAITAAGVDFEAVGRWQPATLGQFARAVMPEVIVDPSNTAASLRLTEKGRHPRISTR